MNPQMSDDLTGFLEALGNTEEPMGMFYTDKEPQGRRFSQTWAIAVN